MSKSLKEQYEDVVLKYTEEFIKLMGFEEPETFWVADEIGGVFYINDYWFSFENMKTAIDNKMPSSLVFEHYDLSLEKHTVGESFPNLISYYKGAR